MSLEDDQNRIVLRKLQPQDYAALKHMHDALFPIDYDASFFQSATTGDRLVGFAATAPQISESEGFPDETTVFVGNEQFIGFITAKEIKVSDMTTLDRHLLGLVDNNSEETLPPLPEDSTFLYILTLGVAKSHRKKNIASNLLKLIENYAVEEIPRCLGLYLHVITYNKAATNFYEKNGFTCLTELRDFYYIRTGRALYPDVPNYDAYLYLKRVTSKRSKRQVTTTTTGAVPFSSSIYYLWQQFTRVCVPLSGSYYRNNKKDNSEAPTWLKNLFIGGGNGENNENEGHVA